MINIPEEISAGIRIDGNKIYVLNAYRSNPLFLSFKKSYEQAVGSIEVSVKTAEELQSIKIDVGSNSQDGTIDSRIINIYKKIFGTAAARRASDIHITTFKDGYSNVFFRVNGRLELYQQLSHEEGKSIMRSIYQNITTADVSYLENEYQAGQIHSFDDSNVLPENVSSIRIQRGPILNGYFMVLRFLYAYENQKSHSIKIGEILLKSKAITEETLNTALRIQDELKNKGQYLKLGDVLVNNRFVSRKIIEDALFKQKGSLELGLKTFREYGYTREQALILTKAARQPQGMVLFSGPTGSGKTTALKKALEFQWMMYPDKAIYTIEDPPEYPIIGAKQLPVLNADTDEKRESKFAEGLRVAMRSDPDILMVGEIRDSATANAAFDAVITGHQMWSTIHAIDVFAILLRLERFGLDKNDLYDEKLLNVLVGQRLLPRLCDNCKKDFNESLLDSDLAEILSVAHSNIKLRNESGCNKCGHTGIQGRVVVAEVLDMTEELIKEIKDYGLASARRRFESEGFTMMKHALKRMFAGEVDPKDIISIVGNIEEKHLTNFEVEYCGL
jgi:type II secretory ATPase GspE/PulE/Tfp pilus assembly ATPase PilB-like protein